MTGGRRPGATVRQVARIVFLAGFVSCLFIVAYLNRADIQGALWV